MPGSGKTAIRKKLIEWFKEIDNVRFVSVEEAFLEVSKKELEKFFRIILNLLPNRLGLKLSNKLISRNFLQTNAQNRFLAKWGKSLEIFLASSSYKKMTISDREIVIFSLLETGSLYECIHAFLPEESYVFFEEGFLQKSFMFISPLDSEYDFESDVIRYLDNIPLPDMTVYVKNDLAVCYERMIGRPDGLTTRLKGVEKDGILKFLQMSDIHLQRIADWLDAKNPDRLLEIENNRSLDETVDDLGRKMKLIFQNKNGLRF